jgi:hypothetical protein
LTPRGTKEGGGYPAALGSRGVRNDSSGLVAVTALSSTNRARFSGTIGPNQQLTDTPGTSRSQRSNRSPLTPRPVGALRRPCFRGFRCGVAGQPDAAGFVGRRRRERGASRRHRAGAGWPSSWCWPPCRPPAPRRSISAPGAVPAARPAPYHPSYPQLFAPPRPFACYYSVLIPGA